MRATSVTYKSGTGPDDEIWKGVSKLMEIKVDLPNNFFGDVKLEVSGKKTGMKSREHFYQCYSCFNSGEQ